MNGWNMIIQNETIIMDFNYVVNGLIRRLSKIYYLLYLDIHISREGKGEGERVHLLHVRKKLYIPYYLEDKIGGNSNIMYYEFSYAHGFCSGKGNTGIPLIFFSLSHL